LQDVPDYVDSDNENDDAGFYYNYTVCAYDEEEAQYELYAFFPLFLFILFLFF
jgi:hypothetical protein